MRHLQRLHPSPRELRESPSLLLKYQSSKVNPALPIRGRTGLDIGCGQGETTTFLADSCNIGLVVGIDTDAEKITEAKRRRAAMRLRPSIATFLQADMRTLPFADNSFTVVNASGVLHHLPKSEQLETIYEMQRVTRRIGLNIVSAYTVGHEDAPGAEPDRLFEHGELRDVYESAGWNVITEFPTSARLTRSTDPAAYQLTHVIATPI